MATYDEIKYRLPMSAVRFSGKVVRRHDAVLERTEEKPTVVAEIVTVADESRWLTAKVKHGWLADTSLTLETSDDGRLSSTSVEAAGQGGKLVAGVLTTAAAVGGVLLGAPATAVFGAATIAAARRFDRDTEEEPGPESDERKILRAYERAHHDVAAARSSIGERLTALRAAESEALSELASSDPSAASAASRRLHRLREGLIEALAEQARLDAHFAAWRASTVTETIEDVEELLSLRAVREAKVSFDHENEPAFDDDPCSRRVKEIWDRFGILVMLEPNRAPDVPVSALSPPAIDDQTDTIKLRQPRRVTVEVFRKDGQRAVLSKVSAPIVVDDLCEIRTVRIPKKRLFGKRSTSFKTSPLGGLSSITSGSTSSGAAIGDALGAIPGEIASGLESGSKTIATVRSLQGSAADLELARLKRQVELKQQEIALSGLATTEADAAELARLKQRVELLAARNTLGEVGDTPDELRAQIAALQQQVADLSKRPAFVVVPEAVSDPPPRGG